MCCDSLRENMMCTSTSMFRGTSTLVLNLRLNRNLKKSIETTVCWGLIPYFKKLTLLALFGITSNIATTTEKEVCFQNIL
jgi:hypothetical protein